MSNKTIGLALVGTVALAGFGVYRFISIPSPGQEKMDAEGRSIAPVPVVRAADPKTPDAPVVPQVGEVTPAETKQVAKSLPPPPTNTPAAAISVRETKPEGASYDCAVEYSLAGQGRKHGVAFSGTAHFEALQVIHWRETVEKNDGETVILLRDYSDARSCVIFSEAKLGINDALRGIAPKAGGAITTAELVGLSVINPFVAAGTGAILVATTWADEEHLQHWPFIGGIVKAYAQRQAGEARDKMQVFQKQLADLSGKKIRVEMYHGKVVRAEYTDGQALNITTRKWAERFGPYADYNLVPDTRKMIPVGEEKDYAIRQIAMDLGLTFEPDQEADGAIRLRRQPDNQPGLAVFEGRSLHRAKFFSPIDDGTVALTGAPEMIHTKFTYGPSGNYVAEAFLSCSQLEPKITKDGWLWGQNDDVSGNFTFSVRYSCTALTSKP